MTGRRFFETRGEAAAGGSEDEAEGEVPPEEEAAEDGSEEEEEEEEWDPNDLGCVRQCCGIVGVGADGSTCVVRVRCPAGAQE